MFNPFDPDHGFSDYFEAAATRNITLLRGFEELAEGVDSPWSATTDRRPAVAPRDG